MALRVAPGTIPSKILRESALYYSGVQQRGLYGVDYSLKDRLTVKNFMHRKDVVVETQRDGLAIEALEALAVELVEEILFAWSDVLDQFLV